MPSISAASVVPMMEGIFDRHLPWEFGLPENDSLWGSDRGRRNEYLLTLLQNTLYIMFQKVQKRYGLNSG